MLFNFDNGTVDLRTGEFREQQRQDLFNQKSPVIYDPEAECPTWLGFLNKIFAGNNNLIDFLQRTIGYAMTGQTSEQSMFILYGSGANGKSTLCDVLNCGMGSYGMVTPASTLMAKGNNSIPNDVARLQGVRFVTSAETDDNRRFAEATIKQLTGDKKVSARFMRGEYFEFTPILKLFLSTNHKPQIKGTDNGIWRRVKLIPFTVTIPPEEQDHHLYEKLIAELPGIMRWAIQGCMSWQKEGLNTPSEVQTATNEYRSEMDVLRQFLDEECVTDARSQVSAKEIYSRYTIWCEENGERAESQRKFGQRLFERGFDRVKLGTIYYTGMRLRAENEPVGGLEDPDEKPALPPRFKNSETQSEEKVHILQSSRQDSVQVIQKPAPEHLWRLRYGMTVDTPEGRGVVELVSPLYVLVNIMGNDKRFNTPLQISMITPAENERSFTNPETP